MAEHDAGLAGEGPHFHQRVFHACNLAHGAEGFKDHGGANALGAEVAELLDLQEIKEGIGIRRGQQTGFFPARQLPRCNAKYPQNVRSIVSFHYGLLEVRGLSYRATEYYAKHRKGNARAKSPQSVEKSSL